MNNLNACISKYDYKNYKNNNEIRWCPGCGDYVILSTIQKVFSELKIDRENTVFVSGIGCSSRFPYYMNTYGLHTIHGRAIPIATGIKMSNPKLNVWIITGDGDSLSIGGNHLLHCLRRNIKINIIMFNNRIYGLTKGQYSPTSLKGKITKSSPYGSIDNHINVSSLILGMGASFYARTIDSNVNHMSDIIKQAYYHEGTSFVEIYQNCVVFNNKEFFNYKGKEIFLENGKKMLFNNNSSGIGYDFSNFKAKIYNSTDRDFDNTLVYDNSNNFFSNLCSSFESNSEFPIPFGIFKKSNNFIYENEMSKLKEGNLIFKNNNIIEIIKGKDSWAII